MPTPMVAPTMECEDETARPSRVALFTQTEEPTKAHIIPSLCVCVGCARSLSEGRGALRWQRTHMSASIWPSNCCKSMMLPARRQGAADSTHA